MAQVLCLQRILVDFFTLLCVITTICLAHEHPAKQHRCLHDKIEHQLSQQFVVYNEHASTEPNHRRLLPDSAWSPIRIRPYYDPVTITTNTLSAEQIAYIKSLLGAAIDYLQQFVYVMPIQGPLLINRCPRVWFYDDFAYSVCAVSDYAEPLKCQYASIPDDHFAESWYYDDSTKKSRLYQPAGNGIQDADLVIYVTYTSGGCASDGSTLAWASPCSLDQYGRPIAGTINYCTGALDAPYWKFDVEVTLHELLHTLIMSKSLFPFFYRRESSSFYGSTNVIQDLSANSYIITPKVQATAQSHFGCSSLAGAPLENESDGTNLGSIGSHWESKFFTTELMCSTIFSAMLYLSDFTLSLMEDSGWYAVDYNYSQSFTWGKNEGCSFVNGDCIDKATATTNFDQYWCETQSDDGCSPDYTTLAFCGVTNHGSNIIPTQFQWYSDSALGGPSSHDYCAFRSPQSSGDYEQICMDLRGNSRNSATTSIYPSSVFARDSRCVQIKDGSGRENGYCFQHECMLYNSVQRRYDAIRIVLSDGSVDKYEALMCYRSDMYASKKSIVYGSFVQCPNIDTICGATSKPFACQYGIWNDDLNQCICAVGYIGSDCSMQDTQKIATEATVSSVSASSYNSVQYGTGICIENCLDPSIDGFYQFDGEYEGLPSYQLLNSAEPKYLYVLRFYSEWNIGNVKGDTGVFVYCQQPIAPTQTIDVQYCPKWIVWNHSKGTFEYDANIRVFHCSPTSAPTVNPTASPSLSPTSMPSPSPTFAPTEEPTVNPTLEPTWKPTSDPTTDPTSDPTSEPTVFPTRHPSIPPTLDPTSLPSTDPTKDPTVLPSMDPTVYPTNEPTMEPTQFPSDSPTALPSMHPTVAPTSEPTMEPSFNPSVSPTYEPTNVPTANPTTDPTVTPTNLPSLQPSVSPTVLPSMPPTVDPTTLPTSEPTYGPTHEPTVLPTDSPTAGMATIATTHTVAEPTAFPTVFPTDLPSLPTDSTRAHSMNDTETARISVAESSSDMKEGSTMNGWLIGVFTFVGICLFMNAGFVFLWKRVIKRKMGIDLGPKFALPSASNISYISEMAEEGAGECMRKVTCLNDSGDDPYVADGEQEEDKQPQLVFVDNELPRRRATTNTTFTEIEDVSQDEEDDVDQPVLPASPSGMERARRASKDSYACITDILDELEAAT